MRDFIDVFPINQNSHLNKKISAYEMQYGANLLHKTNLHGLQHQSSTSANEKKTIFDSWKLSTLALFVNISIESVLFLFQKVCVHWIDTAWPCKKNINAENIVYLCFNILISERQWKLRELVPSFHSWDKENYSLLT